MRHTTLLLLGALLVSCMPRATTRTGVTSPTSTPPGPGPRGMRFLALGDSYTIGEGVAERDRWPVQLAALLRARGVAIGEPEFIARTGWTTDELSVAIAQAKPHGPCALVSLMIGVNNQYRRRDAEEYRLQFMALLEQAIAFARGEPRRVIVLSIPDWSVTPFAREQNRSRIADEIDRFNALNRDETERRGARYVDITPESRVAGKRGAFMFADDGLHPSAAMHREWAEAVLPEALAALGVTLR